MSIDPTTSPARASVAAGALVDEGLEVGLLGDEAEQQRDAGHRPGGDGGDGQHPAPTRPGPGQPADVAGAALVVDDPDDHEGGGLERAVGQQHDAAGGVGRRRAPAEHGDHEPELADRAVGQQQLEVGLAQRPQPAADHRHDADA